MNKGNVTINIEKLIDNFKIISNREPLDLDSLKEQTTKAINAAISSAEIPTPPEYIPVVAKQDNDGHWYMIPENLQSEFNELLEKGEHDEYEAFNDEFSEYMTGGDLNNKRLFIEAPKTIPRTVEDLAMNPELEKRALEKFAPINNPYITVEYKEQLREQNPEFYKKYILGEWKEGAASYEESKKQAEALGLIEDKTDDIPHNFSINYSWGHCEGYKEGYKNAMTEINGLKKPGALEMVEEFHKAYNCPVLKTPAIPDVMIASHGRHIEVLEMVHEDMKRLADPNRSALRMKLILEEFIELYRATFERNIVQALDGLSDLLYVIYGTHHEFGTAEIAKEAFREVHRSNMSKLGADGKPVMRDDGKVLKGPNFTPPDLVSILERYERNQDDIKDWIKAADKAKKEGYNPNENNPDEFGKYIQDTYGSKEEKPLSQITPGDIELKSIIENRNETYIAYYQGVQIGYMRVQMGHFRVDYKNCGGVTVYQTEIQGIETFNYNSERERHLKAAKEAIINRMLNDGIGTQIETDK